MKRFQSFISKVTVLSLVLGLVGAISPASAAGVTSAKDTMSRLKISTLSNHEILFTTPTGVASGATIILTFNSDFSIPGALDFEDIDLSHDSTPDGVCNTGDVETVLAAAPSGATVGVVDTSSTVITFTNGTTVLAAGSELCVEIGTNATSVATGVEQVTNASTTSTAGTKTLAISGTFGDTGTIALGLIDNDQVTITASVDPTLTFDLDVAAANTCGTTESATPYNVPLGTVTTSNSKVSGTTDTVNLICLDLDTNASGGAVVTVKNANGANGLASTSVPADDIDSVTGTIANGTENYGICVTTTSATTGSFTEVAPFNDADCTADEQTPAVGGFDGTSQALVNTGGNGISVGRVTVTVAGAISGVTDAHSDYTDTQTYIATGTF